MITDRNSLDTTRLGLEVGYALEKLYPGKIPWEENRFLIGNRAVVQAAQKAVEPLTTLTQMAPEVADFVKRREKYLLYR